MATEHNFKVKKGLDVLGGDVNLGDGFAYKIDGTTVVDSSRNLTNIGTIEATSGHTTGKFAVKYTGVHASYDFYNNGTTYLNGTTEVNAEFRISSSSSYTTHFNYQDAGNNIISQANGGSTTIRNNNGNLFTLSGGGSISVVGNVIAGSSSSAAILRAHYNDGSYMSLEGFGLVMNRGASYIRPSTNADKTLYIGGADSSLNWASVRFRAGSGLYLNGTQFIDASRNLKNIGTINNHSIDSIGGFGFHHSSSTMTRAVGTGAQWIKVASFTSGGTKFITLRVIASGDNTTATDVFLIGIGSYGMPANILKLPSTKYNVSKLTEVRTKWVTGATYEIWIKVSAITTSVGYLTVSMNAPGVVSTLSAGTEPSVGSADTTLQVNDTDRNDYTLQASKTISAESGFAVGSNQVIDSNSNLTNIGTISSGAITATGASSFVDLAVGGAADSNYDLKVYGLARFEGTSNFTGNVQVGGFTVITSARNIQNIGNINIGGYYAMDGVTIIDASKNLTNIGTISSGNITSSDRIQGTNLRAINTAGYGQIEVGGSNGGYIDLKKPDTDDYDVRIVSDAGTGGRIQSNGVFDIDAAGDITLDADGGDIHLRDDGSSMASFTTAAATFAGTISSGAITSSGASSGRYTGLEVVNTTNAGDTETAIGLGVVSASNSACDVKLVAHRVAANSGSDFYIEQTDSSGNQQERFRITEAGKVNIAASTSTSSSNSLKLHVGTINNTGSSAIAQFGGFVRASEYYILHASTGSTDSLFIDYVGDDMDITSGEGGYSGGLRANTYKIGTSGTTVIDSSRNLTNIGSLALSSSITLNNNQRIYFKNSSGSSNSSLYRAGGNATRFQYADNAFIFDAANNDDFEIRQSGDAVVFKVDVQSTVANTSVYTTGNFNAAQNIQTNGTTRITSVGNLTNIGSITASGNLQAQNATFTGTGDVTVKIIADTDNVTEGDNPTLGFSQDGNTAGTLFVLGLEGNENTVFQGSKVNAPYIHANVGSDNHPLSIGNNSKLVAQFNSTAASPALTITKFSNITGTNGSTILNLKNYMGSSTTDGDLSQQKSFIDFQLLDGNANEVPQVRIGAEVGEGGDANSQTLEGSGAFVVYTNDADTDGSSSIDAGSSLTEKFRVAHDGTSTFTNNVVIGGNLTVNGTQTTLNTATLQVEDKNIVLNYGTGDTSGSADGAGITIQDAVSGSSDAAMTWNAASDYFNFSHKINIQGDLQSYNVYAQDYHVLNDAGTGWHEWATRSDNRVNLSVHDISFNGVARSTNNANVDGPNFNVSTTNKSTSEYAYRVDRSGTVVGGIRIDGRLIGPEATINGSSITSTSIGNWNTAYGWGNHASAGYLTASSTQSKYLRSDADDTFTGNLTSGNNNWIRFVAANATDTNDGKIGAGVFATGLNIVGAQTSAGTGRQVRIWGDLLDSAGNAFVKNNANITTGTITVGTTTDSSKITFPDKNVSDNPTASGDKRQLIAMGNSGGGGMWQTTGRGGLMLASADDSLILASGDVGRGHDPDAGGWNPNPDDENIYLLTDSAIYFRTNLQTVADYKQMSFDANGDLAVARNISASGTVTASGNISSSSGIQTAGTTRLDSTGNLINIGAITATGNVQHTGLTMTSGTDIDQLYTVTDSLTLTTSYQDTSINSTELSTGTYIMQLYIAGDHSVGGSHYNEFYSGVISWYGASTNSPEVDEIVLHRAGHAPNSSVIHLRTQRNYSGGDNLVLQIKGNYNMTAARNYVFKFRRMI